jgi:hypothetical protein
MDTEEMEEKNNVDVPKESKVGKKLSDLTTRRTIILVLAMLFSVPIFSRTTYITNPDPYTFGLKVLSLSPVKSDEFNVAYEAFWQEMRQMRTPIISLYFSGLDENGEV